MLTKEISSQIYQLNNYTKNKVSGLLDHTADTSPITSYFNYNFNSWMTNKSKNTELSKHYIKKPVKYTFIFNEQQLKTRNDNFNRYGVDANALSKIVTRISNLESLFRNIEIEDHSFSKNKNDTKDMFVRYSQSN